MHLFLIISLVLFGSSIIFWHLYGSRISVGVADCLELLSIDHFISFETILASLEIAKGKKIDPIDLHNKLHELASWGLVEYRTSHIGSRQFIHFRRTDST